MVYCRIFSDFLPENTKGPDVRQCWSLWTKMHVTRKQSSTFLDSVKFLILPKFNSNSIIELALLVFMYF